MLYGYPIPQLHRHILCYIIISTWHMFMIIYSISNHLSNSVQKIHQKIRHTKSLQIRFRYFPHPTLPRPRLAAPAGHSPGATGSQVPRGAAAIRPRPGRSGSPPPSSARDPPFYHGNHGKTMGKPWENQENHGKTMGKLRVWENRGNMIGEFSINQCDVSSVRWF